MCRSPRTTFKEISQENLTFHEVVLDLDESSLDRVPAMRNLFNLGEQKYSLLLFFQSLRSRSGFFFILKTFGLGSLTWNSNSEEIRRENDFKNRKFLDFFHRFSKYIYKKKNIFVVKISLFFWSVNLKMRLRDSVLKEDKLLALVFYISYCISILWFNK